MGKQAKPTTTTEQPPQWVSAAQQNMLSTAGSVVQPYLAQGNWNPDQMQAFEAIRQNLANPQFTSVNPASMNPSMLGAAPSVGASSMTPASYNATTGQAAQLTPDAINQFMNPYENRVVKTTLASMRNQQNQDLNAVRARAAAGSSFGGSGSRAALQESQLTSDFGLRRDQMVAQLRSQGYSMAQAAAMANAQMQQQMGLANLGFQNQAGQQNAQFAQQAGLSNAEMQQRAALANAGFTSQYDLANQQAGNQAGQTNAGFQQAANLYNASGSDQARQTALQQLLGIGNYQYGQPLEAMKAYAAMMPQNYGGTKTTSAPQGPSMLQQLLGLGLSIGGSAIPGGGTLIGSLFSGLGR